MAFPYVKTNWVATVTPLSEANMDHLETQFDDVIALLTTRGDIPYRGAATWERLAKGGEGDFLKQGTNDPYWDTVLTVVRKTADQTVNNSEVLINDTHLLFAVLANEIWEFVLSLRITSPTAVPDIDWLFAIPVAASLLKWQAPDITPQVEGDGTVEATIPVAAGALEYWECHYVYIGGVNAGNVQMQWAQKAATGEDTKVLENSFIIAHKLG